MHFEVEIQDADLLKAASIRCDRHFPAMEIARCFGGSGASTPEWKIMESFTPKQILDEIEKRGLDISGLEVAMAGCPCCPKLLTETTLYQKWKDKALTR